jgi:hypothetical protein
VGQQVNPQMRIEEAVEVSKNKSHKLISINALNIKIRCLQKLRWGGQVQQQMGQQKKLRREVP